ncbi:hypothetical protein IEE94_07285 [Yimella sp. cx-573]|nr:hypothetical protein [Yimella sp. cx-573]
MTEYLLVFAERDDAEEVADELREEEFDEVRVVREALAGEDDSEDHDWAVYVRLDTIDDPTSAVARALVERFEGIAADRDGWLDEDVRDFGR